MPTRMDDDAYGVLAAKLQETVAGTTMEQLSHQDLETIVRDMMELPSTQSKAWDVRSREAVGNMKMCSPTHGLEAVAAD